ncbi:porin family protein [Ferrimonas sediminicola]|uniref:Porin family protein n=1 Tax=Ferrimonas sediminicola TaxID=2569538 RepID=A0A4U1B8W1_9GAMM|nr:outer membrane beta-barrel protein [Ferrimonas sediminicola]TKB46457.1 porin family protein [Ferrimonas sediminicola]
MVNVKQVILGLALVTASQCALAQWNFQGGIGASYLRQNNSNTGTESDVRPNLQFGVFKPVSDHWSMGTSLEYVPDDIAGSGASGNLLNWRVAEFGYQFAERWAVSFYGGAARYDRTDPGWGYGAGLGLLWLGGKQWALASEVNYVSTDVSFKESAPTEPSKRDKHAWATLTFKFRF